MAERLVDLITNQGNVLHTCPVEAPDLASEDEVKAKAMNVVAPKLVPDDEIKGLTPRMHVSRGGPVVPYGDDRHILSGTRQGLEKVVGERAYFLWQNESCPDGRAEDHWQRALDEHLRQRAYFIWQDEGQPEGQAAEHWRRSCAFETYD
ncbi:MAG TPA: DUF2934 domain-containing protein [Rhodopila sp.]